MTTNERSLSAFIPSILSNGGHMPVFGSLQAKNHRQVIAVAIPVVLRSAERAVGLVAVFGVMEDQAAILHRCG